MKLIHITDTHFVKAGDKLFDLDPQARLNACIRDINRHHSDADLCVITGDLTHWGELEAYQALFQSLQLLRIPYKLVMGNHDHRETLLKVFPQTAVDAHGFIQSTLKTPAGRFLFLDTVEPGTHAGRYCRQRLSWLSQALDEAGTEPVYLFMHHPPFEVGLKYMDALALQDREVLADVVHPYRSQIRHLFFGHVHRPISGSWCDIPFTTLRAMSHQVWLDFEAEETVPGSHEPPAYAIVLLGARQTVVHFHDFMDNSPKYILGSTRWEDWQQEPTAA